MLGEARRPWLDPEVLKPRFHALSAAVHPDHMHSAPDAVKGTATDRFAELNAAYTCLRDPKERVAHLLQLELGHRPADVQRIPAGTTDLFTEVGSLCHALDRIFAERENETSPMRRLQLFGQGLERIDSIQELLERIGLRRDALLAELRRLNANWEAAHSAEGPARRAALSLGRLAEISQLLGYFSRWSAQLEERLVRLAL